MEDDQTDPEMVLLVLMERAFKGPTHEGVRILDWAPQLKRVLKCVRENDPMTMELRGEIERLRAELEASETELRIVRASQAESNAEVERLRAELAECRRISVARQVHIERLCRRNKFQCAANGCPGCAVCGPVAAIAAKSDTLTPPGFLTDQKTVYEALRLLCIWVEECGASPALTRATSLCCDILAAIGNEHNPANPYAAERVKAALAAKEE